MRFFFSESGNLNLMATSKNVIPVKTGIYNQLKLLDSRFRGSDRLGIIRGSLMYIFSGTAAEISESIAVYK